LPTRPFSSNKGSCRLATPVCKTGALRGFGGSTPSC